MTSLQQLCLELLRAGLKGDYRAIRRAADQILAAPPGVEWGGDFRGEIASALASSKAVPAGKQALRYAQALAETGDSLAPFTVERLAGAPAAILPHALENAVQQVVAERRAPERLQAAGLDPTKSILLIGEPGVGKTMTARYIAASLGLPLITVDLAVLVSSYLGKTGQNLRAALEYARSAPCVFFIDEFDAVGKRRDDPADVGELKRIVNVLLLELERWPADNLLIAATNHPELLDRAVWRRFDSTIRLGLPDRDARRAILERSLSSYGVPVSAVDVSACSDALVNASGSDIAGLVRLGVRETALSDGAEPIGSVLMRLTLERLLKSSHDDQMRREYCRLAHERGDTQREIAARLGVSHVTVGKLLKATSRRKNGK